MNYIKEIKNLISIQYSFLRIFEKLEKLKSTENEVKTNFTKIKSNL
jgi:hypothetical protein